MAAPQVAVARSSLRAKRSNPSFFLLRHGLLRRFAPLRKRCAFVAGNDGGGANDSRHFPVFTLVHIRLTMRWVAYTFPPQAMIHSRECALSMWPARTAPIANAPLGSTWMPHVR